MLAILDGTVGVIVLANTSMAGEEMNYCNAVLEEDWKEAEGSVSALPRELEIRCIRRMIVYGKQS